MPLMSQLPGFRHRVCTGAGWGHEGLGCILGSAVGLSGRAAALPNPSTGANPVPAPYPPQGVPHPRPPCGAESGSFRPPFAWPRGTKTPQPTCHRASVFPPRRCPPVLFHPHWPLPSPLQRCPSAWPSPAGATSPPQPPCPTVSGASLHARSPAPRPSAPDSWSVSNTHAPPPLNTRPALGVNTDNAGPAPSSCSASNTHSATTHCRGARTPLSHPTLGPPVAPAPPLTAPPGPSLLAPCNYHQTGFSSAQSAPAFCSPRGHSESRAPSELRPVSSRPRFLLPPPWSPCWALTQGLCMAHPWRDLLLLISS